ncbi:MAG: dihydroorotase [Leptolyngbyaceae cyanobacterium MO_188.B28]|nr:dihydroorotase [Leptolyngbyaceae cyanobacterium MO_188.B28]
MPSHLIQQVRVLDPISAADHVADVLIVDGWIRAIAPQITDIPSQTEILPGQGKILGPGLVDLYSHSGEPGFESRETLTSLTQAAIAGGFTRLGVLPNTAPPIDDPAIVAQFTRYGQSSTGAPHLTPQLCPWGALTLGTQGEQLTELNDLAAAGAVGFTDGKPLQNPLLVRRLLEYLQPLAKPIALWPCDLSLAGDGVAREGNHALQLGLPSAPAMAETSALASLLECIAEINTPVHIMRVSTARSVELIQQAKANGLPITASTTWMHLLFSTANLHGYDPNLRLDPPLGEPTDQKALVEALKTGILDAIALDHSPYTYEEKTVAFSQAPPGVIGLELALPILWRTLVDLSDWPPLQLWQCLSTQAAQCLGQSPPSIQADNRAELILFDPQASWTVEPKTLKSLARNTPWLGKQIQGQVLRVWC